MSGKEELAAGLDRDEAAAKAAASVAGPDWHHGLFFAEDGNATTMILSAAGSPLADTLHRDDEEMAPFIARHDPARELRVVAALRAILEICADIPGDGINFTFGERNRAEDILEALAGIYAED